MEASRRRQQAAKEVHRRAEGERQPQAREILFDIERAFQRLAEIERWSERLAEIDDPKIRKYERPFSFFGFFHGD